MAPCRDRASTDSAPGTAVRDGALVSIIVCVTPGSVSCAPSEAAAARNDVTPGTTLHLTPPASSASVCSRRAPYTAGSPSWRRTAVRPPAAPPRSASVISSRTIPDASRMAAPSRHMASIAGGTSDPEYTTVSASRSRRAALTVISSGSPGPQPTNHTVPPSPPSGTLDHQYGKVL